MIISILGCGWFGMRFAARLIAAGHQVKGSTTSLEKLSLLIREGIDPYIINLTDTEPPLLDPAFFICDVLTVTVPPRLKARSAEEYWSAIKTIAAFSKRYGVKQIIYISSTSVYADVNGHVTESTIPDPTSASGKAVLQAESFFKTETAFTTTIVRFAGLIGPGRDPANFFTGKKRIPNGQAPVNLIHLEDCVDFCLAILSKKVFGYTLNLCSPHHPRRMDFYVQSAVAAGVTKPDFIDELKEWKIVDTQYESLLDHHYRTDLLEVV